VVKHSFVNGKLPDSGLGQELSLLTEVCLSRSCNCMGDSAVTPSPVLHHSESSTCHSAMLYIDNGYRFIPSVI
jgi:hypothetical protein